MVQEMAKEFSNLLFFPGADMHVNVRCCVVNVLNVQGNLFEKNTRVRSVK